MGDKTTRGHCPNCRAERNAEILAEDIVEGTNPESQIWSCSQYAILRCLGCDNRYIRRTEGCDVDADPETGEIPETVEYWPSRPTSRSSPISRPRPPWLIASIDDILEPKSRFEAVYPALYALLEELYAALDANLPTLATIGTRTVFDCACNLLGVSSELSFEKKLGELQANGKIGVEEKEILHTLVEAGHGAAHRGWKPTPEDLDRLLRALELFLERALVMKHEIRHVKKSVPARK